MTTDGLSCKTPQQQCEKTALVEMNWLESHIIDHFGDDHSTRKRIRQDLLYSSCGVFTQRNGRWEIL